LHVSVVEGSACPMTIYSGNMRVTRNGRVIISSHHHRLTPHKKRYCCILIFPSTLGTQNKESCRLRYYCLAAITAFTEQQT
jgi:hypothetical protein